MNIPAKSPLNSSFAPPAYVSLAQQLRLGSSRCCLILLSGLHVLAILAIALSKLPLWVQILMALSVLLHQSYFVRQWQSAATYQVSYQQGYWWLLNAAEEYAAESTPIAPETEQYKLVGWSFCSRYLLILIVEDYQHKRSYWPVAYDSCRDEEFRWLKATVQML